MDKLRFALTFIPQPGWDRITGHIANVKHFRGFNGWDHLPKLGVRNILKSIAELDNISMDSLLIQLHDYQIETYRYLTHHDENLDGEWDGGWRKQWRYRTRSGIHLTITALRDGDMDILAEPKCVGLLIGRIGMVPGIKDLISL